MLPLMLSGVNRHRRTNLYDCTYEAPRVVGLYYRHRKQNSGCPGLGGEGSEGLCLMGTEFQFGKMTELWRQRVVTAAHQRECANATGLYT